MCVFQPGTLNPEPLNLGNDLYMWYRYFESDQLGLTASAGLVRYAKLLPVPIFYFQSGKLFKISGIPRYQN